MFNSLRAAWHMPPLKFTPVTPGLTEAVTAITLNLKEQKLSWLELRRNDTAAGGAFAFRPNIYDAGSRQAVGVAGLDPAKYTVFSRAIDLKDNGTVTTEISAANLDAEDAFGMLALHEIMDRMRTPDGKKRLFRDILSRAKPSPPGFGVMEVSAARGITASAEASFKGQKPPAPGKSGGPS